MILIDWIRDAYSTKFHDTIVFTIILSSKNNYTFSSSFSPLGVYVCRVEIIFLLKRGTAKYC